MVNLIPSRLRPTRLLASTVMLLLLGALVAPAARASEPQTDDPLPPRDPQFGYVSGLEPGRILGGIRLPVDWSQRVSPCPSDPDAAHFHLRVAPTMHPPLCPGDESEAVINLQVLLTEKKLYRGPITGIFDKPTQYAVFAFHKIVGPSHPDPRSAYQEWIADPPPGDWTEQDWAMLEDFDPQPPKARLDQPNRVEVDIGHQVMYLIADDEVDAIMPVSTGSGAGERGCRTADCGTLSVTPRTENLPEGSRFYAEHGYGSGWSPLGAGWSIYKAIFYRGQYGEWNYGLHGYRNVPNHPASHGCTRLTVWDMDYLRPSVDRNSPDARVWVGMVIHVWDE
ncbi:MAG: L,D-transpeptidase [Acidimicrobiia bacterium]|nr:L,D-transpeptidase [Acidimicrobiia bacterium]